MFAHLTRTNNYPSSKDLIAHKNMNTCLSWFYITMKYAGIENRFAPVPQLGKYFGQCFGYLQKLSKHLKTCPCFCACPNDT